MKMNFLGLSIALLALAGMGSSIAQPNCGTDLSNFVVGINVNPLTNGAGVAPFELVAGVNVVGADIQVACELQRQLGFNNISFVNFTTPSDLSGALAAGTITAAISDLSITPASTAATTGLLAVRYMNDPVGLVFPSATDLTNYLSGNAGTVTGGIGTALSDLEVGSGATIGGATVAVIAGSNEEAILIALNAGATNPIPIVSVPNSKSLPTLTAVGTTPPLGGANLYFLKNPTALQVSSDPAAVLPNVTVPPVGTTAASVAALASSGLGVFVNAACPQLAVNIQAALNTMVSNGFFSSLATTFPTLSTGGALPATATLFPAGTGTGLTSTAPVRNHLAQFILDTFCPPCTFVPLTDVTAGAATV